MSHIKWTMEKLPMLGVSLLSSVLRDMSTDATVRFGIKGHGVRPNYEVKRPDKQGLAYPGGSRNSNPRESTYNEKNLSGSFTYQQIEAAIAKASSASLEDFYQESYAKNDLIGLLRKLNSKERYWLLWNVIGRDDADAEGGASVDRPIESDSFVLTHTFCKKLQAVLDIKGIPADIFWAMDYHLDWLWGAKNVADKIGLHSAGYRGNQQDVDLLIVFKVEGAVHMIMIEAKGVTPWDNQQLASKMERMNDLFGVDGDKWVGVTPHFVLMSPSESSQIDTSSWPVWALKKQANGAQQPPGEERRDEAKILGSPHWIKLEIPVDLEKFTRCDGNKKSSNAGTHVTLGKR